MFSFSDSPKGLQYVQILNVNMKLVFIWANPASFGLFLSFLNNIL